MFRLLLVTPRFFPFTGGVENHVYQVARRLVAAGLEVTVLTANPGSRLPAYEEIEGIKVERMRAWPARGDFYFAPAIYRRIRQARWDMIHVQSYHTFVAPLAMLAAIRSGQPFVVTFHAGGHSSRLRSRLRGAQQTMLRPLLSRAACLVGVANFEIAHFSKRLHLPASRFRYIPNGADLPKLPAGNYTQNAAENDTLTIASIGRLERYKGHQRLIAALPELLKVRPQARLWIAGTGPYRAALLKQARKLGVAEHIEIRAVPAGDRAAMAEQLGRVSLVALLSEYETHPIAVLEAIGLGRPVLVADNSGLKELAEQGYARAIPLKSTPRQVAEAILAQLEQPLQPEHQELELPTWDGCAAQLLALYKGLVRGEKCGF